MQFKDRKHFEEKLTESLSKARDPFSSFPSKQPESTKDKKAKEITDNMRERAGRQGKLESEVKAGKPKSLSNDERHDMSHNLAIHDMKQRYKFNDAKLTDRLNGHGAKSDRLQDELNDIHDSHQEKSDAELTAAHNKLQKGILMFKTKEEAYKEGLAKPGGIASSGDGAGGNAPGTLGADKPRGSLSNMMTNLGF